MKTFINIDTLARNYINFKKYFRGEVYYAVKANHSPHILRTLRLLGIDGFDVASTREMQVVRKTVGHTRFLYTHPIKSRQSITESYANYNIRNYVVDSVAELQKLAATVDLQTCEIIVRIKVPIFGTSAMQNLDEKFGVHPLKARDLLYLGAAKSAKIGVSFHVGSQQEDLNAHWRAVAFLADLLEGIGLQISLLSIGGGFPARYDDPQANVDFSRVPSADSIRAKFPLLRKARLVAEPGRCIVADAANSHVRVNGVDGDRVFIDDGIYGGLLDCGLSKMRFPISCKTRPASDGLKEFTIFGPTCDSLDVLPGRYLLPRTVSEGDVLVVHNTGAYCDCLTNNFNGLASPSQIIPYSTNITMPPPWSLGQSIQLSCHHQSLSSQRIKGSS